MSVTHWNAVAGGWSTQYEWIERNFKPLTDWLIDAGGCVPGADVLDVACGAGYPALTAATSVRPGGSVIATDISREMISVASRRAAAAGLDNIRFLEMSAEQLQFGIESFDSVTNAYGLMFSPDPLRAVGEAYRVLKPGGRFAALTWDEPSKSPFFSVIAAVAAKFLSLPAVNSGDPGPFRLAHSEQLASMLRAAGFSDVRVSSCPVTFDCESSAEYCRIFADLAWKSRMASLSEATAARFRDAIAEAAQPYVVNGRLHLLATSLCASGRK